MNNLNLLNNSIQQTSAHPAHSAQTNAADLNAARGGALSEIARTGIADANASSLAPSANSRSVSPAFERFKEELHLWCEEKCGRDEYSNRIRAKEIMIECFKASCATLALSHMNLTSLPEAIGSLAGLLTLDLSFNQLTSLPNAIGCLTGLHSLYSPRNHLTSLPDSIGCLTGLHILDVGFNRLRTLPDAIGSLRSLQELSLSNNRFTSFPSVIASLTELQHLNMSRNHLTSLPDSIGSLRELQRLLLNYNELAALPEVIGSLTNLREFSLRFNSFPSLPSTINLLTGLQFFDLANSRLTSLPDSILTLSRDCQIYLSNTTLSIGVLTHLREETTRALYHGPYFFYSMPALRPSQEKPLATMISELYRIIDQPGRAFPNLEVSDQGRHLRSWLNRLSYTATYQRGGDAQKQFVSQIVRYLVAAEESEAFRSILMPILQDASETCGDRVTLSILHVGVGHRLHHFDLSDPKGLSQFLIRGPMTLSILEQYARELIPTFQFVDEIEVYLGLPVMLKERLSIPIDVSEMLYFQCSNLTETHLGVAAARVHAQIDDLETRNQFLIEQSKWLEALEKRFPTEMALFREEYDQKLESASNPLSVRSEYEGHLKTLTKQLLQE